MPTLTDRRKEPKSLMWHVAMRCHRDASTRTGLAPGHNDRSSECRACRAAVEAGEAYLRGSQRKAG